MGAARFVPIAKAYRNGQLSPDELLGQRPNQCHQFVPRVIWECTRRRIRKSACASRGHVFQQCAGDQTPRFKHLIVGCGNTRENDRLLRASLRGLEALEPVQYT